MSRTIILTLGLILAIAAIADALTCPGCGFTPCQVPNCCSSGYLGSDVCGCCSTCAPGEGEPCGGPFLVTGTCAPGLVCHRRCEDCIGVVRVLAHDDPDLGILRGECVFPFKFNGQEYNNCTKDGYDDGQVRCAIEVDDDGNVLPDRMGVCGEYCPGAQFECGSAYLFNLDGICVKEVPPNPNNYPEEVLPGYSEGGVVPQCPKTGPRCVCAPPRDDPLPGEGCSGITGGFFEQDAKGWCFLEYVSDYLDPSKDCYEDASWSAAHGRFWSGDACETTIETTTTDVLD